jgi:hypothetical protein
VSRNVKPITPAEIKQTRAQNIPDEIIQVFNELIAKEWSNNSACVQQDEAAQLVSERMHLTKDEIYKRHLLDVEDLYRAAGWQVDYDKPAYNESTRPFFVFSNKGRL